MKSLDLKQKILAVATIILLTCTPNLLIIADTYPDWLRNEGKARGNVTKRDSSPARPSSKGGVNAVHWSNISSTRPTFSTTSQTFPYENLSKPEGLKFKYVNYESLLGIDKLSLSPLGPKIALVWGKGKIDYVPEPRFNPVDYRPYVLNQRGNVMGISGKIAEKSHLFCLYYKDRFGWKPVFYVPATQQPEGQDDVVNTWVKDLISSSLGKEVMLVFEPLTPTNPVKRFLLSWTGDRLKIFHKSRYDRYQGSERYNFNTYIRQRPVYSGFEVPLHPAPASFCHKQYKFWDGNEYDVLKEELTWWGFDLDADMKGYSRKTLQKYRKDFEKGLIQYRSDPLELSRQLEGGKGVKFWLAFKDKGLAIIYRIEGRKKERLFAYQPYFLTKDRKEKIWVLIDEELYEKGKSLEEE